MPERLKLGRSEDLSVLDLSECPVDRKIQQGGRTLAYRVFALSFLCLRHLTVLDVLYIAAVSSDIPRDPCYGMGDLGVLLLCIDRQHIALFKLQCALDYKFDITLKKNIHS